MMLEPVAAECLALFSTNLDPSHLHFQDRHGNDDIQWTLWPGVYSVYLFVVQADAS